MMAYIDMQMQNKQCSAFAYIGKNVVISLVKLDFLQKNKIKTKKYCKTSCKIRQVSIL